MKSVGLDLQIVGWIAVTLGLVISRWVLMDRLGLRGTSCDRCLPVWIDS
ncbi:MAG: hypothetical protein R2848_09625 [Thermomicrobiales bacterium]